MKTQVLADLEMLKRKIVINMEGNKGNAAMEDNFNFDGRQKY